MIDKVRYIPVKALEVQGRALGTLGLCALCALGALGALNGRGFLSATSALGALGALGTRRASRPHGLVVFVHVGRGCEKGQSLDPATEVEG